MKRFFVCAAMVISLYSCGDNGGGNSTNTPDSATLNPEAIDGKRDTGRRIDGTGGGYGMDSTVNRDSSTTVSRPDGN
jgi:hypothetical protein